MVQARTVDSGGDAGRRLPELGRGRLTRRRGSRGAVLAEFVVSFIPLMTTFFTFVQVAKLSTARIAVRHSAIVAARAAAVMTNSGGNNPGTTATNADVEDAAKLAVAPWLVDGSMSTVTATVNDSSSIAQPYGFVSVAVTANVRCSVPLGRLMCPGGSRIMTETVAMPHQGARYQL